MPAYPFTFRAAVLEESRRPLVVQPVTFPGPLLPGQVLVKVHFTGICGKQLEEIAAPGGPDPFLPHMLGHEGSGLVVDVGPGVRKTRPGDKVVLHWLKGSGMDAPTPWYVQGDRRINAGWITTFNEYAVAPENRVTPIPADTDLALACLLGCGVTTGVGVIIEELKVKPGESVAVVGCGGVGLNAVQGAALVQADPIIAVDTNTSSLDLAMQFGATHAVNARQEDPVAVVRHLTAGRGAQFVVVVVGSPVGIEMAVELGRCPGTVILVAPPKGMTIAVDPFALHMRRTITGSYGGGTFPDESIPAYLALHAKGRLKLRELISAEYPLDRINDAIAALQAGQPGRCVIRL